MPGMLPKPIWGYIITIAAGMTALSSYASVSQHEASSLHDHDHYEHSYYVLESFRLRYSEDLFNYCVEEHGISNVTIGSCLLREQKLQKRILDEAQDELGRRSLAQAIYDVCRDYYPLFSVARIDDCIRTHLMLINRLEQSKVRQTIYDLCDVKWRKHSARAVNNCSILEANYYRNKGRFRGE